MNGDEVDAAAEANRTGTRHPRHDALTSLLVDAAPIGLGIVDDAMRFRFVNPHLADINGRPPAAHVGHAIAEVLPRLWPAAVPLVRRALDGERVADALVTGPSPADGGGARTWQVSLFPLRLATGRRAAGVVVRDVTDVQEHVQRLARSEQLLAETERLAHLGSWEWRVDDDLAVHSPELVRIFGNVPGERFGYEELQARVHPDDMVVFAEQIQHAVDTGAPFECRYRYRRPDGDRRILLARGQRMPDDGGPARMFGTVQDITEQVELTEEASRWATLAEHLPIGVAVLAQWPDADRELRVAAVNAAFGNLLEPGGEPDPIGRVVADLVPPGNRDAFTTALDHVLRERVSILLDDVRLPALFGGRVLQVRAFPLPQGQVGLTLEDVTRRRRLEHERAELLHRSVTAADDERQRLAERLHDDVVQSLAAVDLRLQSLAHQTGVAVDAIRAPVTDAVEVLRRTIMELASDDVVRGGLAPAVAAYADRLLQVDGVAVEVRIDGLDGVANDVLLTAYRIVQEALANVRRHAHAQHVRVEVHRRGDRLRGTIVDDGRGLPSGPLDAPGHLGLRLMRERAEVLGGHARVASVRPHGTRVSWDLPA